MEKRYVAICFRHLTTDWLTIKKPVLNGVPFVFTMKDRGRQLITSVSKAAIGRNVFPGMLLADARAICSGLQDFPWQEDLPGNILRKIAQWCLRFTPAVAIDLPEGILLDCSGCAHLWAGEETYLSEISTKLSAFGYNVNVAMADTAGAAWAFSRFDKCGRIIPPGDHISALLELPPASLRLDPLTVQRMHKLGLEKVAQFVNMPRGVLRRRFGQQLLLRLDQANGMEQEHLTFIEPPSPYEERLPCLEPIMTAKGIEIALQRLLNTMCSRLQHEGRGLRKAILKAYRIDGQMVHIAMSTNHPSHNTEHLLKLFLLKISGLEPGPGVEVFVLQAERVEPVASIQDGIWRKQSGLRDVAIAELLDRVAGKAGPDVMHRYLPLPNYWPEQSCKITTELLEQPAHPWSQHWRPVQLLPRPLPITVTAPIPDYPPMNFRCNGKLHEVKKADFAERIERPWWMHEGQHRDYYAVEDQDGQRFWIFRLGHYDAEKPVAWFIHGFFA